MAEGGRGGGGAVKPGRVHLSDFRRGEGCGQGGGGGGGVLTYEGRDVGARGGRATSRDLLQTNPFLCVREGVPAAVGGMAQGGGTRQLSTSGKMVVATNPTSCPAGAGGRVEAHVCAGTLSSTGGQFMPPRPTNTTTAFCHAQLDGGGPTIEDLAGEYRSTSVLFLLQTTLPRGTVEVPGEPHPQPLGHQATQPAL